MQQNVVQTHQNAPAFISLLVTCSLVLGGVAIPQTAYAETTEIDAEPDAYQQKIEETSQTYDEATKRVAEIEQQIADNEARIAEIEEALPEQMERGADAWSALYQLQRESYGLIEYILNAENFGEFLTSLEYLDRIQRQNTAEIDELKAMKEELETTRSSLADAKTAAAEEQERAETALSEAQAAREEAQRRAQEEAARQAAEEAAAAQEAAQAEEKAKQDEESAGDATDSGSNEQGSSNSGNSGTNSGGSSATVTPPTNDNADWSSDKATFVSQWAGRIDAYLAGSPLSGQGATFAAAAWDYGVDPRWSPAISNTESSKGLYCFRSYNAWGWGNISWGSWEEAINAHVRGLARGYGYTISVEAAKKYCPPNWEHWYNATLSQMNMI